MNKNAEDDFDYDFANSFIEDEEPQGEPTIDIAEFSALMEAMTISLKTLSDETKMVHDLHELYGTTHFQSPCIPKHTGMFIQRLETFIPSIDDILVNRKPSRVYVHDLCQDGSEVFFDKINQVSTKHISDKTWMVNMQVGDKCIDAPYVTVEYTLSHIRDRMSMLLEYLRKDHLYFNEIEIAAGFARKAYVLSHFMSSAFKIDPEMATDWIGYTFHIRPEE